MAEVPRTGPGSEWYYPCSSSLYGQSCELTSELLAGCGKSANVCSGESRGAGVPAEVIGPIQTSHWLLGSVNTHNTVARRKALLTQMNP